MSDLQKLPQGEKREAECKACASVEAEARYAYSYDSNLYEILQCLDCSHMFMYPVPLIELDSRTMDTLDDAELFGSSIMRSLYEIGVINREVGKVRRHLTQERPTLLDIGCGTGWNSSLWQKKGFDVTGLEPSQTRREFGEKRYGLKMIDCHVEELHTLDNFDVVVMRHVLEHFAEPFSVLEKVYDLLNPGGLIVIALPNINSIGRYVFKEDWEWVLPWHLNFFQSQVIAVYCEKGGV